MKLSRDSWLALALLAVLLVTFVGIGIQQSRSASIPYLSTSPAPDGTLALKLWLEKLGYRLSEQTLGFYQPPADADIVLVLNPITRLGEPDLKSLNAWVEKGGTAILAGNSYPALLAFQSYKFTARMLPEKVSELAAATPLFSSPPQTSPPQIEADYYLTSERADFVTLFASQGNPIIVSFTQGKGLVILSTAGYPFSNAGLKEQGNETLVLNLVSISGQRQVVWFDEWHHGIQGNSIIGPSQWLRRTPPGHALVFGAFVVFLALLLQGQSFGRPVPLPRELRRRGPLEHVTAVANLNRKAGHRGAVLLQYRQQLKRHLGRRYRLDPLLPDAEYVRVLAGYHPGLDQADLLDLLAQLSQKDLGENDLVILAARASKWLRDR